MLKSIFIQLWNRKQSNIWLFFELLLVFCLTWYITDYLFVYNYNRNIPNYRDTAHTWQIQIEENTSKNPDYSEEANAPEVREANYARIVQAIRNYPGIETVGISFIRSYPGSGSYTQYSFDSPTDSTRQVSGRVIRIDSETDFFKVFRYSTDNGKKPVSVKDFEWTNPRGIVIGKMSAETLFPGESAVGKKFKGDDPLVVLGIVDDTKRFDYLRPQYTFYYSQRVNAKNIRNADIAVRLNPSVSGKIFQEKFLNEMTSTLQIGNFYLKGVTSYEQIATDVETEYGVSKDIRIRTYLMIFFLLNIVLCVIGTFWYRVNLRKEEIGLRRALGSTKNGIRNILIGEGLCLLSIVLIPAMIIEYQFVHADLIETLGVGSETLFYELLPDKTLLRFLITNAITWVIMAAVTVLSIWLPATKAAELEAADALRDE